MKRITRLFLTVLCVMALGAAACSDDDNGKADAALDLIGPDIAQNDATGDKQTPIEMSHSDTTTDMPVTQPDMPVTQPDMPVTQPDMEQPDLMAPDKSCGKIACNCSLNGQNLWGKVKVVTALADFKVQVVTVFPDLKVKKVTSLPNSCGKWQFITSGIADFTIQEVTALPDFKIKYVTTFPGMP